MKHTLQIAVGTSRDGSIVRSVTRDDYINAHPDITENDIVNGIMDIVEDNFGELEELEIDILYSCQIQ